MRTTILALALAGALSGCTALTGSGALNLVARETALGMIRTANAMGVDPWRSSPEALARWEAACRDLAGIATVWNPMVPGADADVTSTCAVVLAAARPGAVRPASQETPR